MSGYDWEDSKAEENHRRHGVTFDEAETVLDNPLSWRSADEAHSWTDERFMVVGWSSVDRLLMVVVSESGRVPRIISARRATKRERDAYTAR
jgi:uncharacterized DUF497 family protein